MRTILSLMVALAACGGGAVCAGCSDDGGGPVDTLPESFALAAISGTAEPSQVVGCDAFIEDGFAMNVRNLSSDCTCYTANTGTGSCSMSSGAISCVVLDSYTWTVTPAADGSTATVALSIGDAACGSLVATIAPL